MVVRLVFLSLLGLAVGLVPVKLARSAEVPEGTADAAPQGKNIQPGIIDFVSPQKEPLIVELGRSRLLHFSEQVRRTALSNENSSTVFQVSPTEVLVLGTKEGSADLCIWPLNPANGPVVVLVRVQQRVAEQP